MIVLVSMAACQSRRQAELDATFIAGVQDGIQANKTTDGAEAERLRQRALKQLFQVLGADSGYTGVRLVIARTYRGRSSYQPAIRWFEQSRRKEPEYWQPTAQNAKNYYNLGYCQLAARQWDAGLENVERAVSLDPTNQLRQQAGNDLLLMSRLCQRIAADRAVAGDVPAGRASATQLRFVAASLLEFAQQLDSTRTDLRPPLDSLRAIPAVRRMLEQ